MPELDEKSEVTELTDAQKKEIEISEKLSKLDAKLEDSGTLAKLMSDPDVRALLEAKQRGQKAKVTFGEEESKKISFSDGLEDIDVDSMSPKELKKHLLEVIAKGMESTLSSKLRPLVDQIKNVSDYIGSNETKTAVQQVEAARKKFKDFDTFVPDMRELNKRNPDLGVEELYTIARLRKGVVTDNKVSSEKPTNNSARVPAKVTRKEPLPAGQAGFDQLLGEALETIEIPTDVSSED